MRKASAFLSFLLLASAAHAQQDVRITNEPCGGYPAAAVATGTTGAVTATLTANANSRIHVCAAHVSYVGGTSTVGPVTITGTLGGTLTYYPPPSVATGGVVFEWTSAPCWPASGLNTNIAVATTANATATNVAVDVLGCMK